MSIVFREGLGRPLTYAELDENFRTVARVGDTASGAAEAATRAAAQAGQSAQSAAASAAAAGGKVSLTGNETIAGIKTFSSSPLIPTPAAGDSSTKAQTTAGSLAQIKATGWGLAPSERAPVSTDANLTVMPGIYTMAGGGLNKPGSVRGALEVIKGFEVEIFQTFRPALTSDIWVRSSGDGGTSWNAWSDKGGVATILAQIQSFGLGTPGTLTPDYLITPGNNGNTSPTRFIVALGSEDQATAQQPEAGNAFSGIHIARGVRPAQLGVSGAGSNAKLFFRGYSAAAASLADWQQAASSSNQSFSGPIRPGQYTLTTLPSASTFSGYEIDVTNATGGPKRCRSNGTAWQILNTTMTVS